MSAEIEHPDWNAASRCSATAKSGRPCRSFATDTGKCRKHSMSAQERQEEARKGALATNLTVTRKRAQKSTADLTAALAVLPSDLPVNIDSIQGYVETLKSVITATAAGKLTGAQTRAITGVLKLRLDAEQLQISSKLLELEKRLNDRQPSGGFRRIS